MRLRVLCVGFTLCVLVVAASDITQTDEPESAALTQDGKKGVKTKKPLIGSYGPLFTSVASLNSILEDGLQQPDPTVPQKRIPREATPQQNRRQKVRLPSVHSPLKRIRRSNERKKPPRKVGGFSAIARPAKTDPAAPKTRIAREATSPQNKKPQQNFPGRHSPLKDPEAPKTRIAREATSPQNEKPRQNFPGRHSPLKDKITSPILPRQRRQNAPTMKKGKKCIGCYTALITKDTPPRRSRRSGGKGKKRRKTPPGGGSLIQQIRKQDEKSLPFSRKKREDQDPQQSLTWCPGCYSLLSKLGVNPTHNPEENADEKSLPFSRKKREDQDPQQSLTWCPGCYSLLSKPGVNPTHNPEEIANEGKPRKPGRRRHGGVRGRKKKHGPPEDADHHGEDETGRPDRRRGSRRRNKERRRHEKRKHEGFDASEWTLDEIHTKVPETGVSDQQVMMHKLREKRNTDTKRSQRKFEMSRWLSSRCPGCFSIMALLDNPVVAVDQPNPYVNESPVAEEFDVVPEKPTPEYEYNEHYDYE